MNCLADGILRARIDGELSGEESREVDRHLESCSVCQQRAEALTHNAKHVTVELAALAPRSAEELSGARLALLRFQAERRPVVPHPSIFSRLFPARLRPAWAAAAALAVLVACFSIAPARSWAQRLLAMLRVQKIAVVPIDLQAFAGSQGAGPSGKMIGQLISDNIVVTMHSDQPQSAPDAAQASQLAGFPVRLLGSRSDAPQIAVMGEQGFQMTLNRDRLRAILDEFGRTDLQLPSSIDGALLAVHIPKAVSAVYGKCPKHGEDSSTTPPKVADLAGCVMLGQVPSPTISVPPELNIQELATLALQAAGMSAQDAEAYAKTVDWTSTLVVPIPTDAGSYETTNVDGAQATLITLRGWRRGMPGYSLLWVKNGIIYSLTGFGSADQAVPLADSLE